MANVYYEQDGEINMLDAFRRISCSNKPINYKAGICEIKYKRVSKKYALKILALAGKFTSIQLKETEKEIMMSLIEA